MAGQTILELAGVGPAPFAAMLLADLGADVIRVERPASVLAADPDAPNRDVLSRGRRSIGIDLQNHDGRDAVLTMVGRCDAMIEGFRPGVAERLGLGPDVCLDRNPRLVYGRMTGWGQDGPYAQAAGHDINYIALAGALAHIGRTGEKPVPPLNLVGDFGGGGMFLAFGIVCGLLEAQRSGHGQVIDAAMVDGTAVLMNVFMALASIGRFDMERRGTNLLDTGAPFYDVYETADGKFISIASLEPQFYAEMLRLTGLEALDDLPVQMDKTSWPAMKPRMKALFLSRTRDEWCALLEMTEVCFAPVLTMEESFVHPHNVARGTFVEIDGMTQAAPAPRFSRTPGAVRWAPPRRGEHTDSVLLDFGLLADEIEALRASGAVV